MFFLAMQAKLSISILLHLMSFLRTEFLLVSYVYVSIELIDCILLSPIVCSTLNTVNVFLVNTLCLCYIVFLILI